MQYSPIPTFLQEAEELLAEIEAAALTLGREGSSEETIHKLFRSFHTIKGSGAMCGFERLAAFTHTIESLLDQVREGAVPVSPELAGLVLAAKDHIRDLLIVEQTGAEAPSNQRILESIAAVSAARTETAWNIRFRPDPGMLASGGNPVALFRDLRKLGECRISADLEAVPPLEELQADQCYYHWNIRLLTSAGRDAIRDVFLFVEDGSELEIAPETGAPPVPVQAVPSALDSDAARSAVPAPQAAVKESSVRVPAARLDRLVNLVGELVMNQSRLTQAASRVASAELAGPVEEIERLIAELRDNVLGIRMMPIGSIFGRFRRLVHDLSTELGKEIDLVTDGEETELDKSVLDQLGEPLVHLLRNSIDHGIERVEDRVAAGKPPRGSIRLAATHSGAGVVVSIGDDGRGLNAAAIRSKAVEKGLIAADADLSEKEILGLVFQPGFSTARQVTNLSGRGVGLDVVKRQIEALRGSVSIGGEAGRGATFQLRLPLTLAIIDGLLVEIGGDQFIIPMAAVVENVELRRADRNRNNGRNIIAIRGELVPYIDLRAEFSMGRGDLAMERVVVVQHEDERVGLVVDRVVGTHQTVIQSMGRFFRNIEVVSGSTVMGDGRVALILDPAAVVRFVDRPRRLMGLGTEREERLVLSGAH